jgi:hypothetical protein
MSINALALIKDLATWSSAAAAIIGAITHKVWSKLVGAEKAAAAEIAKLVAAAKKV